jgi:hypothetical protein
MQKAEQGRPSSSLHDEWLNGETHFIDKKERGFITSAIIKANKLQKETIYYCKTCSEKPFFFFLQVI